MTRPVLKTIAVVAIWVAFASSCVAGPVRAVHVVYQLDSGNAQSSRALRNIRNHLIADPGAQLVVVALGQGIDFLVRDAVDEGGYPYELIVDALVDQQVRFEVCGNTLESRGIRREQLIDSVSVVHSGMAEIARLQAKLGYAYIKP